MKLGHLLISIGLHDIFLFVFHFWTNNLGYNNNNQVLHMLAYIRIWVCFKETTDGLKKCPVECGKFPLELEGTLQSPFYLVQVWVWEMFKNL